MHPTFPALEIDRWFDTRSAGDYEPGGVGIGIGAASGRVLTVRRGGKPLVLTRIGAIIWQVVTNFGHFCSFGIQLMRWLLPSLLQWRTWARLMPQLFEVGNRSLPVITITGTFVGLVLAVQSYDQLKAAGFSEKMGILVTLTLVKELGPVLAGVMLAGRVGGAMAAELGTMQVTEQLDAMRVMGANPMKYLVVPRFLACVLFTPLLTWYCDLCGTLAGWFIAVVLKDVPSGPYWDGISSATEGWDVMTGFVKSLVFGGAIGLISCYKGFHTRPGAEGVGRAVTESFVTGFIVILVTDFFIGAMLSGMYNAKYGLKSII